MTFRFPIECNICKYKSLIKVQAGYLEVGQVSIGCPNCGSLLKGELTQIPPNVNLKLENTTNILSEDLPEDVTIIPISTELPIPKQSTISIGPTDLTLNPYLALSETISYEIIAKFRDKYLDFAKFRDENIGYLENIIKLFQKEKYDLVINEAKKHFSKHIPILENEFEIKIENGYYIISEIFKFFILNVIPSGYEHNYTTSLLFRKTINNIQRDKTALKELKSDLNSYFDIKRGFIIAGELLVSFIKKTPSFVPVIALSYTGFDKIFNDEFGLTTFSFDDLKDSYKDAFELIARSSILFISFTNYSKQKDFNNFSSIPNCNSLEQYHSMSNGNKKEVISHYPYLVKYYRFLLDNQLRNAIGHVNTEYLIHEQIVRYYPYTNLRKQNIYKEKTLIDFAYHTYLLHLSVLDLVSFIGKWNYRIIK